MPSVRNTFSGTGSPFWIFSMPKAAGFHPSSGGITAGNHSSVNLWEAAGSEIPKTMRFSMPRPSCIRTAWKRRRSKKSRNISNSKEKQVFSTAADTKATIWCLLSVWQNDVTRLSGKSPSAKGAFPVPRQAKSTGRKTLPVLFSFCFSDPCPGRASGSR